jgi:hypothetical protein
MLSQFVRQYPVLRPFQCLRPEPPFRHLHLLPHQRLLHPRRPPVPALFRWFSNVRRLGLELLTTRYRTGQQLWSRS